MTATTWRRLSLDRDHRWVQPRVSDYVDGELPPRHERRLAAHAELCPDCARMIATLGALVTALPALRLSPGASFAIAQRSADYVLAQIEEWESS